MSNLTPNVNTDEKLKGFYFYMPIGLSIISAFLGILKAIEISIDKEVLYFFLASGFFLVLTKIKKISIGDNSVELFDEKIKHIENLTNESISAISNGIGGKKKLELKTDISKNSQILAEITHSDDPQKGRFGGQFERNERILKAGVTPSKNFDGNYDVELTVSSTNENKLLEGSVTFYLHDTFNQPVHKVKIKDNAATLRLLAYGAFTVGAVADDGDTLLELDLSKDEKFPKKFRER